jgi:hypothetical protein
MKLSTSADVAMVLPLPTPPGSSEDVVRFIDISAWPHFFEEIDRAFRRPSPPKASGFATLQTYSARLVVHESARLKRRLYRRVVISPAWIHAFGSPTMYGRRCQTTTIGDFRCSNSGRCPAARVSTRWHSSFLGASPITCSSRPSTSTTGLSSRRRSSTTGCIAKM